MSDKPKPFQIVGAKHLASDFHKYLADAPGLGKTWQFFLGADMINAKHILYLCPASVRLGIYQEAEERRGHTRGLEVISYNNAGKFAKAPTRDHYDLFGGDEAQFVKTLDAGRTQAVFGDEQKEHGIPMGLARRADYKWLLSGSPLLNRPREIYPAAKFLIGDRLKPHDTFSKFTSYYCGAYWNGHGLDTTGATNLDKLRELLFGGPNPFMLRRTKKEVLPEWPERTITRVPLSVTAEDRAPVLAEEALIEDREAYLSPVHEDYSALGDLARLLRATGMAKVRAAASYIDEKLDVVESGKLVVFIKHRDVAQGLVDALSARGIGVVTYLGGLSDEQKKAATQRFVKDPNCRVFIGNIQAAGTGINDLQHAANDVVFVELSWTPEEMGQCIDRVDRMDKKFDGAVNADILYIPGSLEGAILTSVDRKTKVINWLMEGKKGVSKPTSSTIACGTELMGPELGLDFLNSGGNGRDYIMSTEDILGDLLS